jgi:hypothetical protein
LACPGNLVRNVRLVRDVDKIIGNEEDDVPWSINVVRRHEGDVPRGWRASRDVFLRNFGRSVTAVTD